MRPEARPRQHSALSAADCDQCVRLGLDGDIGFTARWPVGQATRAGIPRQLPLRRR